MKTFIVKTLKLSLPIIIYLFTLLIVYIAIDPFMVIRSYDDYYAENQKRFDNKANLPINRNVVCTMTFLYNTNEKHVNYNSFIFGNSRSMFYNISDWKKHLSEDAVCFHYNAFDESIWALSKKIAFLDKYGIDLKNALLIFDYSTLIADKPPRNAHLNIIPPLLVDNDNLLEFHTTSFKAFVNPRLLVDYFDMLVTKKYRPAMKSLSSVPISCDVLTNEYRWEERDSLLKVNQYYTPELNKLFYQRDTIEFISPAAIKENQIEILTEIKTIFKKHNTKYKVIINPLYDQKKLNPQDLMKLQEIFGADNVFDFSGINPITNDYHNYYEDSHYLPRVAAEILDRVYK